MSKHRPRPSSATLNHIADVLRVDRAELADVLASDPTIVIERLAKLTAEQLRPPASAIHRAPGS
ncbi:MAG TPA: hypothetical protein VG321_10315 [Solirubrobacteraceae bacterium]|nr:hypothetical protein [Solirubrobacteraceae bacterium]